MEDRQPKLIENLKKCVMIRANKTPQDILDLIKDIYQLRGGSEASKLYLRKSMDLHPFEDISPIESMGVKQDCSLFVIGSGQKKRPNNLIMGRLYCEHLLDMFEFGVSNYVGVSYFKAMDIDSQLKPIILF